MSYFLLFTQHFDRDPGLDYGRLSLNHIENGTKCIWIVTSSTAGKQGKESFHHWGGLIPPQYRISRPSNMRKWTVLTDPIYMPDNPGVAGNFYKINPHEVTTDKGGKRGDFGIHLDGNVPGSLGCIVMSADRFADFESEMKKLRAKSIKSIPLFVQYS